MLLFEFGGPEWDAELLDEVGEEFSVGDGDLVEGFDDLDVGEDSGGWGHSDADWGGEEVVDDGDDDAQPIS